MFVIILGEATHVTMEDDGRILSNIRKWGIMDKLLEYENVVEFLSLFIIMCSQFMAKKT